MSKKTIGNLPEEAEKAKKKANKIVGEFKEFISKGNVTDLSVGVIVGTAFTAIVNSLVDNIIMPLIGTVMGGIDLTNLSFKINSPIFRDLSVTIRYGVFLQAVVSFFIIAACVFLMVKALNTFKRGWGKNKNEETKAEAETEAKTVLSDGEEQTALLKEIRDLLKQTSIQQNIQLPVQPLQPQEVQSDDIVD